MRVARPMATGIAMDDSIVFARSIAPPVAKRAVVTGVAAVAPGVIASLPRRDIPAGPERAQVRRKALDGDGRDQPDTGHGLQAGHMV